MPAPWALSSGLLAGLLFALAAPLTTAARWTPLGPFGGRVQTLTVDPTNARVVYATLGGEGGYKSADGGATWTPLFAGSTLSNVAVDPQHPKVLYLAANPGGLLKSADGGAHWTSAGQGLLGIVPTVLTVDPVRSSRLYAGTYRRVWRSRDGGTSWQAPRQLLPVEAGRVTALVASRPAGTVYAGTEKGLFKSVDAGLSWKPVGRSLPAGGVAALAIAPSNPATVYVSLAKEGPFRSTDGGVTWKALPLPPVPPHVISFVSSLAVSPRSARTVYAGTFNNGLFRSSDGGLHWSRSGPRSAADVTAVATAPTSFQTVYAALAPDERDLGGVFASVNGGGSWQRRNHGLAGLDVVAFQVDPATTDVLWAGLGPPANAVFRSGNGGQRWARRSPSVPDALGVGRLVLAPSAPSTVWVLEFSRLWRTTDGGFSWVNLRDPGFSGPFLFLLWADPASASKLWGAAGNRLHQSTDGGGIWTLLPAPVPACWFLDLAFAPSSPSTLYTLGADLGSVGCRLPKPAFFRSTDGGATWTSIDTGLTATAEALTVDPVDSRLLYLATIDGVWKSTDGGDSWTRAGDALRRTFVTTLAASPLAGVVWAGTSGGRILRSRDGGVTWEDRSGGLNTRDIGGLTLDPANPRKVFAFTSTGVWVLADDGP